MITTQRTLMRVRTVFTYGQGGPGLMTNYFDAPTDTPTDAQAQNAVNRIRDMMNTSPPLFSNQFSWHVQGQVDLIADATGAVVDQRGVTGADGAGTGTSGVGPLALGMLLRLITPEFVDGRRLVGRQFFVPISAGSVNGPGPNQGTRDALQAMGDALLAAGITDVHPRVWSRPRLATAVGPHRPAGLARSARIGKSAQVTTTNVSNKYVVLTSRRD